MLNNTSLGLNALFTAKIDDVGMYPSRDLYIHTDIYTREGIETAKRNGVYGCRSSESRKPYQ